MSLRDHEPLPPAPPPATLGTLRDHELLQLQREAEESGEVFKLPDGIKEQVEEQYR